MPRVHPPRLGTLVNPWHRGKKNTVTWSNVTLPRRALFDFFRMEVAVNEERVDLKYISSKCFKQEHSIELLQLLLCATRWHNAPPLGSLET